MSFSEIRFPETVSGKLKPGAFVRKATIVEGVLAMA
jgi:hypothetical protein